MSKSMFLCLAVLLSCILIASAAKHASFPGDAIFPRTMKAPAAEAECDTVYGVVEGDTCSAITEMFKLTTAFFDSINPNINCNTIFVGQWVCVDGSAA